MPRRRTLSAVVLALASALLLTPTASCGPPCETANDDPVRVTEGTVDASGTVYESSTWAGPYLHFPGGRRYQLEHHLGRAPTMVTTYLSFDQEPMPGGNASESAGNQAVIERVDDEIIQVRNDTCAEFWLRVTAIAAPQAAGDAGLGVDATTD